LSLATKTFLEALDDGGFLSRIMCEVELDFTLPLMLSGVSSLSCIPLAPPERLTAVLAASQRTH